MRHLKSRARDAAALIIVSLYVLPILWWTLSAFAPTEALLDLNRLLTLNFTPTLDYFALTIFGAGGTLFDSRQSLQDSLTVALLSTAIALLAAVPMAYALSVFHMKRKHLVLYAILLQRFLPPIAIIFPLVSLYHAVDLIDTHASVALAHAALNLPLAVLVMKSFFDDIPTEVAEAALLDGTTRWQAFWHVVLPMAKTGVAATGILCFIFSWTEFLLALFLTQNLRLVPVQAAILVMNMWGIISSMTVTALVPAFVFVLLAQKHLVRGLTLGLQR